jgi:hypothetical protein
MTESKKNSRTRGLGFVYQPTYRNRKTGEQRRSAKWWIQYGFRGRIYRESSGSVRRLDAVKLLRRRVAEMGRGRLIGPDVERTTLDELVTILLNDYRANRRRSLDRVEDAVIISRRSSGRRAPSRLPETRSSPTSPRGRGMTSPTLRSTVSSQPSSACSASASEPAE